MIQSIKFFKPADTPTAEELAYAWYHGSLKLHSRLRSILVDTQKHESEGLIWMVLKTLGIVGDKISRRFVFEEKDQYLLPEDMTQFSANKPGMDDDGGLKKLRGPQFLVTDHYHIKEIPIASEADVWRDIEKGMESDPWDYSRVS